MGEHRTGPRRAYRTGARGWPRVQLRLPPAEFGALERLCRAKGLNLSQAVEVALREVGLPYLRALPAAAAAGTTEGGDRE